MDSSNYHVVISSQHKWYDLKLDEVWKYKDLILLFTKKNFVIRYKQTILGPAWLIITPLLSSLIYYVVFGRIAQLGTDGIPQILFYMSGNAIWTFFSSCVVKNSTTFTANAHVFGKVYFPRMTIPISNMLTSLIEFLIQMMMVALFSITYILNGTLHINPFSLLLSVFVVLLLGVMGLGTGIVISSLTTKYRDLTILVGFGMQLWMYITPIVYPLSETAEWLRMFILINPVTMPAELLRKCLFGVGTIVTGSLLWSIIFTIVIVICGIMIFNKIERTFMDTV